MAISFDLVEETIRTEMEGKKGVDFLVACIREVFPRVYDLSDENLWASERFSLNRIQDFDGTDVSRVEDLRKIAAAAYFVLRTRQHQRRQSE